MKNSKNRKHIEEKLKDRQAYRQTLIHRQQELEAKIAAVEQEIGALKEV